MILWRMVFLPLLQGEHPVAPGRGDTLELQKELDRVLLANYAPAAVLVSDDLEVLQSRGDTSPYLKLPAGKPSLNLLKMAREGLGFELRNAVAAVKQQKAPYQKGWDTNQVWRPDTKHPYRGYSSEVGFRQRTMLCGRV